MYFDIGKALSYKADITCVVDLRGWGKTYSAKKLCIARAIKKKDITFVWIRRRDVDLDELQDDITAFFGDIGKEFPQWAFSYKGRIMYAERQNPNGVIEKFPIGRFIALSTYKKAKSKSYASVEYIVYDEFLDEDSNYLSGEYTKFLSLVDSIARTRTNVRIIMLANAVSMCNPYFDAWGVSELHKGANKFQVGNGSLVVFTGNAKTDFLNARENSLIGRLSTNTSYGDYATNNKFMLDDLAKVEPTKPIGKTLFMYNFIFDDIDCGIWLINNIYYVCEFQQSGISYTTNPDISVKRNNCIYLNANSKPIKLLMQQYLDGIMYFKNLKIKNKFMELFTQINFRL